MNCFTFGTFVLISTGLFSVTAVAEEMSSTPNKGTLEAMGLGGIEILSDDQAESIRGTGFGASAYGYSWANVVGAGSHDSAHAKGKNFASTKHSSHAGRIVTHKVAKKQHHSAKKQHHSVKQGGHHGWAPAPPRHGKVHHAPPKHGHGGKGRVVHHGGRGRPSHGHHAPKVHVKAVKVFAGGHAVAKRH